MMCTHLSGLSSIYSSVPRSLLLMALHINVHLLITLATVKELTSMVLT